MAMITLDIKKTQDRLIVGQILLDNGYRVWLDIQTRPRQQDQNHNALCRQRQGGLP